MNFLLFPFKPPKRVPSKKETPFECHVGLPLTIQRHVQAQWPQEGDEEVLGAPVFEAGTAKAASPPGTRSRNLPKSVFRTATTRRLARRQVDSSGSPSGADGNGGQGRHEVPVAARRRARAHHS